MGGGNGHGIGSHGTQPPGSQIGAPGESGDRPAPATTDAPHPGSPRTRGNRRRSPGARLCALGEITAWRHRGPAPEKAAHLGIAERTKYGNSGYLIHYHTVI